MLTKIYVPNKEIINFKQKNVYIDLKFVTDCKDFIEIIMKRNRVTEERVQLPVSNSEGRIPIREIDRRLRVTVDEKVPGMN